MKPGDLQTAYVTQISHEGDKGEWIIYNTDEEEIYRLPANLSEKQVMLAIHLGRKFELIAFNKGVNFQKSKNPKTITDLQDIVKTLEAEKEMMRTRNIMLANEMDKMNNQLDTLTIKN